MCVLHVCSRTISFSGGEGWNEGFGPFFMLPFLSSPQEASGRGPVGTDADTFPSWLCCIISSCGITSANVRLSSHCVETLVLCQTVGQGALKEKIRQRRREITGTARSRTHVYILFMFLKVYIWFSFRHFILFYTVIPSKVTWTTPCLLPVLKWSFIDDDVITSGCNKTLIWL